MQITHEEAQALIQFNADDTLNAEKKVILFTHLRDCSQCRAYAEDIEEVESILLPLMHRHWNLRPVPLPIHARTDKFNSKIRMPFFLTTRMAIIGMTFAALALAVWQFTLPGQRTATPLPVNVFPVATPSTQSTSTGINLRNCDEIRYKVREGDTLQLVALQFSLSKDEIMAANNMEIEAVNTSMELIIPRCNFTPTVIIKPGTLTTTYTPVTDPLPSTPDG